MKYRNYATIAIACAGIPAPVLAQVANPAQVNAALNVRDSRQVDLHVIEESDSHWLVETQVDGEPVALFLMPYKLRSSTFEVFVQEAGGMRKLAAPPPARTVRGTVDGWDANIVIGSLVDGQFTGRIRTADRGTWIVEPLARVVPGAPAEAHVCYAIEDVLPDGSTCGVGDTPPGADRADGRLRRGPDTPPIIGPPSAAPAADGDALPAPGHGDAPPGPRGAGFGTEIAFDADVEFFQDNGSSISATVDDIERVMVGVDDVYRSQTAISYIVNRILIRTVEPDPYSSTNPDTLLDQFRAEWENNQPGERDVAHLMTGKDLDGNIIGRAFLAEICNRDGIINDGAYGISQSRFSANLASRVALTAHELGHNWDAGHCAEVPNCSSGFPSTCGIMCACVGGCNGSLTQFGQPSINAIVGHRDSRGCLGSNPSVTFVDDSFVGQETGSLSNPYNTLREGVWATDPGGRVVFFGGTYDADRTLTILNRPLRLEAQPGTGIVRIQQN